MYLQNGAVKMLRAWSIKECLPIIISRAFLLFILLFSPFIASTVRRTSLSLFSALFPLRPSFVRPPPQLHRSTCLSLINQRDWWVVLFITKLDYVPIIIIRFRCLARHFLPSKLAIGPVRMGTVECDGKRLLNCSYYLININLNCSNK